MIVLAERNIKDLVRRLDRPVSANRPEPLLVAEFLGGIPLKAPTWFNPA